jgi:glycosyltransferase involved in cell wall biosynthesis
MDELLGAGIKSRFLKMIWPGINITSVKDIAVGRKTIAIGLLEKMGLQIGDFERVVLCPARLDPTKDIETLIRAAGVLKRHLGTASRVAFLIAGRSKLQPEHERRYEEDLLAIARREGVFEDVFIGSFDINDMYAIYKLCDACVLPSVREALGLVLIEAMALRVPVIVANVDGVTDVAVPEVNSLAFSSRNHDELANCLERVLFDRDQKKRLVKAASRTIRERFSHERMGREHYELYRSY